MDKDCCYCKFSENVETPADMTFGDNITIHQSSAKGITRCTHTGKKSLSFDDGDLVCTAFTPKEN